MVAYDRVNGLDLSGPIEVFATASALADAPAYQVEIVAAYDRPFVTEAGVRMLPHRIFADAGPIDTLIVAGGAGLREPEQNTEVTAWLTAQAGAVRRIGSVCTGIYGLAATGLLDGRRATTHWRFFADIARRFPNVRLEPDRLHVADGPCYTSGGVCAGIDLALALVRDDFGPALAHEVAREMVVHSIRAGEQAQYSELMRVQAHAHGRLGNLVGWIGAHLDGDLSVPALSARAALSERQLSRLVREQLGETPAGLVQRLRMEAARDLLRAPDIHVKAVANAVGYGDADAFTRAYVRLIGETPEQSRARFRAADDRLGAAPRVMAETAG